MTCFSQPAIFVFCVFNRLVKTLVYFYSQMAGGLEDVARTLAWVIREIPEQSPRMQAILWGKLRIIFELLQPHFNNTGQATQQPEPGPQMGIITFPADSTT